MIDPEQPDPSPALLRGILGDLSSRLGPVVMRRRNVSGSGVLYETTRGLFFLPHRLEEVISYQERRIGPPLWWRILSLFWWPLHVISLLLHKTEVRQVAVQEQRIQVLDVDESDSLPDLLMNHPGALFVLRDSIQSIRRRGEAWEIARLQGHSITILPEGERRLFHDRFRECLSNPRWQPCVLD